MWGALLGRASRHHVASLSALGATTIWPPQTLSIAPFKSPIWCAGDDEKQPGGSVEKLQLFKVDQKVVKAKIEACFETPIKKLPKEKGSSQKWQYKCLFCKKFNKALEGKQRAEEHIMASDIHGKAVKGCDGIPKALRDELRVLRGLPNLCQTQNRRRARTRLKT